MDNTRKALFRVLHILKKYSVETTKNNKKKSYPTWPWNIDPGGNNWGKPQLPRTNTLGLFFFCLCVCVIMKIKCCVLSRKIVHLEPNDKYENSNKTIK